MTARHTSPVHVVILGGGFGGLAFVRGLRSTAAGRRARVTLVDRHDFHTILPDTHAVAAGQRPAAAVRIPYSLAGGFDLWQAEVSGVDLAARQVLTSAGPLSYDWLAFALGAVDRDFGVPGVREHALALRCEADARRIRRRLETLPAGAPVAIAGAGLTGVELAAELAEAEPGGPIILAEAGPEILPGLPAPVVRRARCRLAQLGVAVRTGAPVSAVTAAGIELGGERVPAGLTIWCAGVGGHPLAAAAGLPVDGAGRVRVDECLRAGRPDVYAVGDSAAFAGFPPAAQLARQMGQAAGADLARRLAGGRGRPFRFRPQGTLLTLGGMTGAGTVGPVVLGGPVAWWLKQAVMARRIWADLGWRAALCYLRPPRADSRRGSHSASRARAH